MCSVGSVAVTTGLPLSGGNTPGNPCPVSWWHAEHLLPKTCSPSAAHDGWLAGAAAPGVEAAWLDACPVAAAARYALNSVATYHMPHATTTRKSTQAHVGMGAGVSARVGSNASPGRLAKALTR